MRRCEGFTLVEIMVAITITSLLLAGVYGVFTSVSTAKERLETEGRSYHLARVLFDRIGREIRSAYFTAKNPQAVFAGGINEDGFPFLELSTAAATPRGGLAGGLSAVRYELQEEREEGKGRELMRYEAPLFLAGNGDEEGYRLTAGIEELRFRFYDGVDWQEEWRAGIATGLPKMVEVFLVVRREGETVPFLSAFEVPSLQ